jgi:hypothetical protein
MEKKLFGIYHAIRTVSDSHFNWMRDEDGEGPHEWALDECANMLQYGPHVAFDDDGDPELELEIFDTEENVQALVEEINKNRKSIMPQDPITVEKPILTHSGEQLFEIKCRGNVCLEVMQTLCPELPIVCSYTMGRDNFKNNKGAECMSGTERSAIAYVTKHNLDKIIRYYQEHKNDGNRFFIHSIAKMVMCESRTFYGFDYFYFRANEWQPYTLASARARLSKVESPIESVATLTPMEPTFIRKYV